MNTILHAPVSPEPALLAYAQVHAALKECSPELQQGARELLEDLASGELDYYERASTIALLSEMLFPNADPEDQLPGLDVDKAEMLAPEQNSEARSVLQRMDREEATFATKVVEYMAVRGMTQTELAEKVGIGQSAVSMILNRDCRPQMNTVHRFAKALRVEPADLWPN